MLSTDSTAELRAFYSWAVVANKVASIKCTVTCGRVGTRQVLIGAVVGEIDIFIGELSCSRNIVGVPGKSSAAVASQTRAALSFFLAVEEFIVIVR